MWRLPDNEDFASFKNHVRTAANNVLYHRGRIASPVSLLNDNLLLNANSDDSNTTTDDSMTGQLEDIVGAIMKKMFGRDGGRGRDAGAGAQRRERSRSAAPSGPRPTRCGNCGDKDHTSMACTK